MNNHKILDSDNNVCTFKYCTQQDDADKSYCCDSKLEDVDEYSVIPNEFSITAGKQRLFDTCLAKSLIYGKTVEFSQTKDTTNVTKMCFDDEKSMNIISNLIVPTADVNNYNNEEESVTKEVDTKSSNVSVVDKIFEKTICTNWICPNDKSKDFNKSLKDTILANDTLSVTERSFDVKKSLDDIVILCPNVNDALLLSKLRDNTLKYSIDIEMPCSENMDNVVANEISENNTNTSEDLSCEMMQYLEFEQTIHDTFNDISSENCDINLNKSNISGHQTLENISMIEQILCSDSFISMKDDIQFSSSDYTLQPNLSITIENCTLKDNCDRVVQNEHFENSINDLSSTPVLKYNFNEIQDDKKINKSINRNKIKYITSEDISKSNLNETDNNKFEIKIKDIISNLKLDEELDKTKHNTSSVASNELLKTKTCILTDIENNLQQTQEDKTSKADFTAIQCTLKSENINKNSFNLEQNIFLNNDVQQLDLLNTDKNIHKNSSKVYNKLEQIGIFEEDKKLQTFEYKSPKTEKLLDYSIMQQTPTFENQIKKQKLLHFSIVDQTPTRKSIQQAYLDENISRKNVLIDFSAVGQMLDIKVVTPDEIDFKDNHQNSLSNVAPDVELLVDEFNKTDPSSDSNLSFNQTIIDTYLNLSINPEKVDDFKDNIDEKITEETNGVMSSDKDTYSVSLTNKTDEPFSALNKTNNFELCNMIELKQNTYCNELYMSEKTEAQHQSICLLNTTLNQNILKSVSTEFTFNPNKQLISNSNSCTIKDFSIFEKQILKLPELKTGTNSLPVESLWNVSNLIEMSTVSKIDSKSNDQAPVSSDNLFIVVNSDNKSEKSVYSSSDEINNSATNIEEPMFSFNSDSLIDIQMNDVTNIESSEKNEFDELNQRKGNKRKLELDQEQYNYKKKMKIEIDDPKTPMSRFY